MKMKTRKTRKLCPTKIKVLDEILGGGIPSGHTVLLAGSSGTGKTILAQEFLFNGKEFNEKGIYISLVETKENMEKNISDFEFYDKKAIDSDFITILDLKEISDLKGISFPPRKGVDPNLILNVIRENIEVNGVKRVVIDSITAICQTIGDEAEIREFLYTLQSMLSVFGCTTLLISEIPPLKFVYSVFGVEEFIADGVILLMEEPRDDGMLRSLQVIKMRGINHLRTKYAMKITKEGIDLTPMIKRR